MESAARFRSPHWIPEVARRDAELRFVNSDHPVAAGSGRQHDARHCGGVKMLDESGDHPQRRSVPVTGEQGGLCLDGPGQFLLVGAANGRTG
ncbi:hypothetical protein ACWDKQ_31690 [Saccharopolyspora sp. NPDC000995]